MVRKILLLGFSLLSAFHSLYATSFLNQFQQKGYVEIFDKKQEAIAYDALYVYFEDLIEFLQTNPLWTQKLYTAKERFIRSKDRKRYSTDFFGFYDESKRGGRSQISFYYSTHFHAFISSCYPDFNQVPQIRHFFEACFKIQQPYGALFHEVATELGIEAIFSSEEGNPPLLLKVVKYFSSYSPQRPHYDGTAFSLFLDSTDTQSLLLSPYKSLLRVEDFASPLRKFSRSDPEHSLLLIPGALLTEFSLYPTPHIVIPNGQIRYATIAFAMRPGYVQEKTIFSSLPSFKH